jgi:hypothetical protein
VYFDFGDDLTAISQTVKDGFSRLNQFELIDKHWSKKKTNFLLKKITDPIRHAWSPGLLPNRGRGCLICLWFISHPTVRKKTLQSVLHRWFVVYRYLLGRYNANDSEHRTV